MNPEELKLYLCRKVEIKLRNSETFRGYFKRMDNENIVLSNLQYRKEKTIPISEIISIRVLTLWDRFQSRKKFFWNG